MDQHHRPSFAGHLVLDPHAANVDPHPEPPFEERRHHLTGPAVHSDPATDTLALLDWKRTIGELYADVRATSDGGGAWRQWRDARTLAVQAPSRRSRRLSAMAAADRTRTTMTRRGACSIR
jgi:hypothetical protein